MIKSLAISAVCAVGFLAIGGCAGLQARPGVGSGNPARVTTAPESEAVIEPAEPVAAVEPGGVLTLREALALTLLDHPELKAYSYAVRAAEARQLQAGLRPNPELDIEAEEVGGSAGRRGFRGAETSIVLGQVIELGGKRARRVELAETQAALAGWDYEATRLDVLTAATRGFVEVLAAQRRTAATEEMLEVAEGVVGAVMERVQTGKDAATEQVKAEVARDRMRIAHRQAVETLESARRQLAAFWGGEAKFESVVGELEEIGPPARMESLLTRMQENPDLARWTAEIAMREAALELERARGVQDVRVGAGVSRFEEDDSYAMVFGLSIPLGVFDRNQGERAAVAYELAQAGQLRRAAMLRVRRELAEAHGTLSRAYVEAAGLAEEVLPKARQVYESARLGYREGKFDYLAVLDAQRTLFEAQLEYVDALSAYHAAKLQVQRLAGDEPGEE